VLTKPANDDAVAQAVRQSFERGANPDGSFQQVSSLRSLRGERVGDGFDDELDRARALGGIRHHQ
jgi:hypothetical protein